MPKIDISGYALLPLEKKGDGLYPYPRNRYGILPYYINLEGQLVWGCIETNRVGPIVFAPPAGTQDVIVIRGEERLVFETGKPLPKTDIPGVVEGERFREGCYQKTIDVLIEHGYEVYLENPLATAIHESYEEHGIDLRANVGLDLHRLIAPLASEPHICTQDQPTIAAVGLWLCQFQNIEGVNLRRTEKIDTKMKRNHGRAFYEYGRWMTLENIERQFIQEKAKYMSLDSYSELGAQLITETLAAFDLNLNILAQMELCWQEGMYPFTSRKEASAIQPLPTAPTASIRRALADVSKAPLGANTGPKQAMIEELKLSQAHLLRHHSFFHGSYDLNFIKKGEEAMLTLPQNA